MTHSATFGSSLQFMAIMIWGNLGLMFARGHGGSTKLIWISSNDTTTFL